MGFIASWRKHFTFQERQKSKRKKHVLSALILLLIILSYQDCADQRSLISKSGSGGFQVSSNQLLWDQYTDTTTTIVGFKIYYRPSNQATYFLAADIPDPKATSIKLSELSVKMDASEPNYLRLTAYTADDESDPTPDLCWGQGCP